MPTTTTNAAMLCSPVTTVITGMSRIHVLGSLSLTISRARALANVRNLAR